MPRLFSRSSEDISTMPLTIFRCVRMLPPLIFKRDAGFQAILCQEQKKMYFNSRFCIEASVYEGFYFFVQRNEGGSVSCKPIGNKISVVSPGQQ